MDSITICRDVTTPALALWETLPNLAMDKVPLAKKKSEYETAELRDLTLDKLADLNTPLRIYTDGSTGGDQKRGGACIYIEDEDGNSILEASYPAGEYCSSYSGEGVAAVKALEWLVENPADATLCTDSLSLHEALNCNRWNDLDPCINRLKALIRTIPTNITILWLPSHCGVAGNDKADDLANRGAQMDQSGVPVTHNIVKAKIKSRKWEIVHERA